MPGPGKDDSAHTTIEASRIRVPAFLMKLTVLFHTYSPTVRPLGTW